MDRYALPDGRPGRPLRFSDRAIEFCLTLKGLFQLPLRQVTGLVESLLRMEGLGWPALDYTTLCRRQKSLSVDLLGRPSSGGLHLLVDSAGIKMMGEGEWKMRKHGASYRRQWRKVHIGIDAETLYIRALEMTTNSNGDGQTPPDLLRQIPEDETILSVGGDGAYDTRNFHAVIARRGADPVIPVRRNGRAIWKKWSGYHRRNLQSLLANRDTQYHSYRIIVSSNHRLVPITRYAAKPNWIIAKIAKW